VSFMLVRPAFALVPLLAICLWFCERGPLFTASRARKQPFQRA
jgi:hypothetical protein